MKRSIESRAEDRPRQEGRRPMQWHPIFSRMVRPILDADCEVRNTVPVGDLPREADIAVLRRRPAAPLPFTGLWRWLTTWNVLEYKGKTVSARVDDLDLLVELGLGIHRRLNQLEVKEHRPEVDQCGMSWWYLAPHLGKRFLPDA